MHGTTMKKKNCRNYVRPQLPGAAWSSSWFAPSSSWCQ